MIVGLEPQLQHLCFNSCGSSPTIMETPSPGTEADNPNHAIGNWLGLSASVPGLGVSMIVGLEPQLLKHRCWSASGTQRCPEDVVHQALSPSPDLQAQRLAIFSLGLFSLDPLCLHWCFEKGIGIPDSMVGIISFCAGAWSLHDWPCAVNIRYMCK
jgi:hypothetical protein